MVLREGITRSHDKGDLPMLVTVVGDAIQNFTRAGALSSAALCIGFVVLGPCAPLRNLPPPERDDDRSAQLEVQRTLSSDRLRTETERGATMSVDDVVAELVRAIDDAIRDRER